MKSEKEVLDALNVLKSVCEENEGNCRNCMLRNAERMCGIFYKSTGSEHNDLRDWKLKSYESTRLILS